MSLATVRLAAAAAIAALPLTFAEPAASAPGLPHSLEIAALGSVQQVRHRHARTRIRVYPQYYASHDYPYGPPVRGFYDRNPTHQGNINGCVVDLGYGRYESCNANR